MSGFNFNLILENILLNAPTILFVFFFFVSCEYLICVRNNVLLYKLKRALLLFCEESVFFVNTIITLSCIFFVHVNICVCVSEKIVMKTTKRVMKTMKL